MKKTPTLFLREYEAGGLRSHGSFHRVSTKVRPGCEWVLEGKGVATRKWDGTCCLVRDGELWKRYHSKDVRNLDVDTSQGITAQWIDTHEWLGWIPVTDDPEDKWHREAWVRFVDENCDPTADLDQMPALPKQTDGTYELCGPKVNGNPEGFDKHVLIRHEAIHNIPYVFLEPKEESPFENIKTYLTHTKIEGVVWWHKDDEHLPYHGRRMAKIKRRDFGLKWPVK